MQIAGAELLKILRRLGCREARQRGSHVRVECGTCVTTVAVHAGETLPAGTLSKIQRDLTRCLGKGWLRK
jgi:predicted RNA binding protein YcfA (HicA-like mRNA interferase family)